MKKKRLAILLLWLSLPMAFMAQSIYPGVTENMKVTSSNHYAAEAFPLSDVRLLPSRFRENMERDSAWMMSLPVNRLVHSFLTTSGSFAGREGGYDTVEKLGGWESMDCDLRGHAIGHYLSGISYLYTSTGEKCFKLKGDSIVNALYQAQRDMGTGYLSAFPEGLINRNIKAQGVWAPWYTLHKIFAGLIDQYVYAHNDTAFVMAQHMGEWAYGKLKTINDSVRRRMIRNEFGGVGESFYNLYALTGNDHYLYCARFFYHNDMMDPLAEGRDDLGTKHANTFLPKVIAESLNYEINGDTTSRRRAEFLWRTITRNHTFVTGELSDKEHFFDPAQQSKHLTGYTGESCTSYNMLRLSRHLFCWNVDARVADYYERTLYNCILGQQDTQTGMVCYFMPLLSGSFKLYSTYDQSFWCCVGSGFESNAKYGEGIYYHSGNALYVNLFIPSRLTWREQGVTITQQTSYPEDETTTITIHTKVAKKLSIRMRKPAWSGHVSVNVNGKKVVGKVQNGYIHIARKWADGDKLTVTYPMTLCVEKSRDNNNIGALTYGPAVIAGAMGTEGMTTPEPFSNPNVHNDYYTYDFHVPATFNTSLDMKTVRKGDGLNFTAPGGLTLKPLYDIHHERYVVYWNLK